MDRGAVQRPPYWAVLARWAISEVIWVSLDGWCLARGHDLLKTGTSRAYNLIETYLDEQSVLTKEETDAREQAHLQLARISKQIKDFQDDPEAAIEAMDVAPHLRNRV